MPNQITILCDVSTSNSYHVISDGYPPKCASHLSYDEMLGYVARLTMRLNSDGEIPRGYGRPLYLERPTEVQDG